jgi:hypothetical protein
MIYVSFNKSDLKKISTKIVSGDTLISDVQNFHIEGVNIIKPYIDRKSENELINNLNQIFEELNHKHIKGFINVFYEATILPLSNYICTLSNIISELKKNNLSFDVIFPSRILNNSKKSVFFLSEHETQFQFLYQRQLIFQPYLESYCKKNNIKYSYIKSFRFSNLLITLPLRRVVVYSYRLFKSLYKSIQHSRNNSFHNKNDIDFIAVTRLARKSEYIQSLLTSIDKKPLLFSEENFKSIDSNRKFSKKFYYDFSFPINIMSKPTITNVILSYLKHLTEIYFKKRITIKFKGIEIYLNSALKEVLINKIDLELYIKSFINSLRLISEPKLKVLITTELKSPYAYADTFVADYHDFKCFHVMDCDQSDNLIPIPVFGDYLITNTRSSMINFKKNWESSQDKIIFFGNLFYNNLKKESSINKIKKNIICYFTTARRSDDKIATEKLFNLHKLKQITLIIKLHPRDDINFYKRYKSIEILLDDEISREDLFNKFSFGLTYSSAIIHDLMIYNKPFLILVSNSESFFNDNVHDENFKKLKIRLDEINKLKSIMKIKKNIFVEYQNQYLDDIREPNGLQKLKEKLISFK